MMLWLRPHYILAIVTSLYYSSQLVASKTYDKFYCSTEEGPHQITCPDESALLTDVSIHKIYRRTNTCAPDVHSDYLVHCQGSIDGSSCEGNKTCSIQVSSLNYVQCGDKVYAPTYFFVKYTCTQLHTMCTDLTPIRNTLYGFIVSPAYPNPMADNLKCSISIEADPSMFIELAPIQMRLQEAMKCRSEYLEIFGYLNSQSTNTSSDDLNTADRMSKNVWKSYHTWCGADRSTNHPPPHARYLISSNSLYMSLQTAVSKKARYFKIRYKVVPASARTQYDHDGIAYDKDLSPSLSSVITHTTSTAVVSTTIVSPLVEDPQGKHVNGTITKKPFRKEILIGIIAGVIVLLLAIAIGVGIFLLLKRRRRPSTSNNTGKKGTSSTPSTTNSATGKPPGKSADKAPLLESKNTAVAAAAATTTTAPAASSAAPAKRKLVPERTVQISDVNTSRFKAGTGATVSTKAGTATKDTSSTSSETATAVPPATTTNSKSPLTAADSGIYGADLHDDLPKLTKTDSTPNPTSTSAQIYGLDLPDKSESNTTVTPVSVVVNPLSEETTIAAVTEAAAAVAVAAATESSATTPKTTTSTEEMNSTLSAIVVPNHVQMNSLSEPIDEDREVLTFSSRFDDTVKSAYSNLIDATISENEGAMSSASQSRRTSAVRQPLLSHESNSFESGQRKTTPFNPLHVILKKDANKYYTTEYI